MREDPDRRRLVVTAAGEGASGRDAFVYRFVAGEVASDVAIGALAPWRLDGAQARLAQGPVWTGRQERVVERTSTTGWIARDERRVDVAWQEGGAIVVVDGVARFAVDFDPGRIRVDRSGCAPDELVEEALLGPPMILHLAARGIWCLHASAVEIGVGGELLLFVGKSGRGKSTMARRLAGTCGEFTRVADDLVPVAVEGNRLVAFPRFPQLKLGATGQYDARANDQRIVRAIVDLERDTGCREASVVEASHRARAIVLARHTISSRLFDRATLARHLEFCSLAAAAGGFTLQYGSGDTAFESVPPALRGIHA